MLRELTYPAAGGFEESPLGSDEPAAAAEAAVEAICHGLGRRKSLQSSVFSGAVARLLIRPHTIALFFVVTALAATLPLQRYFPYPFVFLFFAAAMSSAWFGGRACGFFAVFLSALAVDYFVVPPFHSLVVVRPERTYFAAFVLCALVASWVSSSKKKNEEALLEARDQLEFRAALRSAELERSNAELRESEQRLRLLTDVIPQQIWSAGPDGIVDYCNQRLLEYMGHAGEAVQGARLFAAIHPEGQNAFRQVWQSALASGNAFEGEWRWCGADGKYRAFLTRVAPLRDAKGSILRWYGANTDVEQYKKAEQDLAEARAELTHLSRMLTMGELAASIAHEVNQPLTAVVAYGHACLEWLSATPPNLEEARQAAARIIQNGNRAGSVLTRIRALFAKEPAAKEWVDMNEVVRELTVFLRDEATRNRVTIRTDLAADLPNIKGDRIQLQQVVMNLIMNGIDAMRESASRCKELLVTTRRQSENEILILVEDCGVGFDSRVADKIFKPFFTTKPRGIGMGLSISRSIVESHEGCLWAAPRPAGGAIFQFTVPIAS
jgi:PAS domain S-box-containing protein